MESDLIPDILIVPNFVCSLQFAAYDSSLKRTHLFFDKTRKNKKEKQQTSKQQQRQQHPRQIHEHQRRSGDSDSRTTATETLSPQRCVLRRGQPGPAAHKPPPASSPYRHPRRCNRHRRHHHRHRHATCGKESP